MFGFKKRNTLPTAAEALPGRAEAILTASRSFINGAVLKGPYPDGARTAIFGLGRRAALLADARGAGHGRGLCGRRDA